MKKSYQRLQIKINWFSPGDYFGGGPIDLGYISVWEQVPKIFQTIELDFGSGPVTFKADWENCAKKSIKELKRIPGVNSISVSDISDLIELPTVNIEIIAPEFRSKIESARRGRYLTILGKYLKFIFLAINLATPGNASFKRLSVIMSENTYQDNYGFESMLLGRSWKKSLELGWPSISQLDLEKVVKWLCVSNLFKGQTSCSRTQRVIYAILNIYHGNIIPHIETLLLAYALEALIDSPIEHITKLLKERLFLLIGYPKKNIKEIKKTIDEFYNLRSRIIHGNFNIPCPNVPNFIDMESFDSLELASAIVISALQKMIVNNWLEVDFEEIMKPKLITS